MKPQYPIFILIKDEGFVSFHKHENDDLNSYEEIDIIDDLYEGWDLHGLPVRLLFNNLLRKVVVEYTGEQANEVRLRNVLFKFAKRYYGYDKFPEGNDFVDYYLKITQMKELNPRKIFRISDLIANLFTRTDQVTGRGQVKNREKDIK